MRKFCLLMAAMATLAMSFTACKEDGPSGVDDPKPTDLTFTVKLDNVATKSLTFSVTPSDLEADYFAVVYGTSEVEQCASNEAIVEMVYANVEAYAESVGKTFDAYMAENVSRGAIESETIGDLQPKTNYYLIVFGVDAVNGYALTSEVSLTRFTTTEVVQESCSFEVRAEVYLNSAAISVNPSSATTTWHLVNAPVDMLTEYTAEDGQYGWTKEEFFHYYMTTEIETLREAGVSEEEIALRLFFQGERTLNVSNLEPKSKYVTFVAGVTSDGADGMAVTTALKEVRYNSGEAAQSDVSFDIQVSNIEHYAADIKIIPSDLEAEYYYVILPYDGKSNDAKPIDLVTKFVAERLYYWDNGELKHVDPVTGVQDFTGENKYELSVAEMEYYILVFTYECNPNYGTIIDEEAGTYDENPGSLTSAPAMVTFTTAENGDVMTAEFVITATEVGPYSFTMNVEAKDPTVYYMPSVLLASEYSEAGAIDMYSGFLSQQLALYQIAEPGISPHRAIEEHGSTFFRNGDGRFGVANLQPETDYAVFILVIDPVRGAFVRAVAVEGVVTTTALGTVNPQIELLGVYDGDEAASIFEDVDTSGKPIVAVKLTNTDGASGLYTYLSDGDATSPSITDAQILSELRGYWMDVKLDVPYSFFLANWDVDQTVIAYGEDAEGRAGKVSRLLVKPTTSGDIEELRGYVEEYNNAAEVSALPKSVVINSEATQPTIECIWSENVPAPREAQVVRHECSLEDIVAVESDVMSLKAIKAFFVR